MKPRITITIDPEVLALAEAAVESGHAKSVSAWIGRMLAAQVQEETVQDVARGILEEIGQPLTEQDEAWARDVLSGSSSTLAR